MSKGKELYEKYKGRRCSDVDSSGIVVGCTNSMLIISVDHGDYWNDSYLGDIIVDGGDKFWYMEEEDVIDE